MSREPVISIIVPTWRNLSMLKLCLQSVAEHSQLPYQLVVHVNGNTDGTLDWVREQGIEHTWTQQNIGISQAMNLAYARCRGEYIVSLNDDMYVLPGWDQRLHKAAVRFGTDKPGYFSGTMIQSHRMSPTGFVADYGSNLEEFNQVGLMNDYSAGKFAGANWSGATWPPSMIHRKWWDAIGGYSVEFSPGYYTDTDFSMKLWYVGCRYFCGIGESLVYHFSETTTSKMRGVRNRNPKKARLQFLKKWGVLPSTFSRYFLRAGMPMEERHSQLPKKGIAWERLRLNAISARHGFRRPRTISL